MDSQTIDKVKNKTSLLIVAGIFNILQGISTLCLVPLLSSYGRYVNNSSGDSFGFGNLIYGFPLLIFGLIIIPLVILAMIFQFVSIVFKADSDKYNNLMIHILFWILELANLSGTIPMGMNGFAAGAALLQFGFCFLGIAEIVFAAQVLTKIKNEQNVQSAATSNEQI
jgi:hypothetical protein